MLPRASTSAVLAAALMIATGLATEAYAHHSFAGYDRAKKLTLDGTVKDFQFMNPHAWIEVAVPGDGGETTSWGVECGSPNMMTRTGWKKSTVKPGDHVIVVVNPLLDGRPSGSLVTITLADGTVLGPGDAPAPKPLDAAR
jgi:hypothetical protein